MFIPVIETIYSRICGYFGSFSPSFESTQCHNQNSLSLQQLTSHNQPQLSNLNHLFRPNKWGPLLAPLFLFDFAFSFCFVIFLLIAQLHSLSMYPHSKSPFNKFFSKILGPSCRVLCALFSRNRTSASRDFKVSALIPFSTLSIIYVDFKCGVKHLNYFSSYLSFFLFLRSFLKKE